MQNLLLGGDKMGSFSNLDNETNAIYGNIFSQIAGGLDSFHYKTTISEVLLKKRQRVQNSNDYIDTLLTNVTFFVEMKKEMLKILERMFTSKVIPNHARVEQEIFRIQGRKKLEVPAISIQNKAILNSKYNNNNAKIEAIEFDYAYHNFVNSLLIEIIGALTNNPSITNQLFNSSAPFNVNKIDVYLQTYANMALENITFSGKRTGL